MNNATLSQFETSLSQCFDNSVIAPFGLAVSGGGDSIALLELACQNGHRPPVITIDHKLRDTADEISLVRKACAKWDLDHRVVTWTDHPQGGNLQNEARMARQNFILRWAEMLGLGYVALGHTKTDQAETFLMRLARGSGVDGLAAMRPSQKIGNLTFIRPLLDFDRQELRDYLNKAKVTWADDPSNENTDFDRIKMRQALPMLKEIGLDVDRLVATANHMSRARSVLNKQMVDFALVHVEQTRAGSALVDHAAFLETNTDTQTRLLTQILAWVSGAGYRPRYKSVLTILDGIALGKSTTLSGCVIKVTGRHIEICRELNAIAPKPVKGLFDGKWRISPQVSAPDAIRPLGEDGLLLRPDWRESGLSRTALMSIPSIWRNGELRMAPILDKNGPFKAVLESNLHEFLMNDMSH